MRLVKVLCVIHATVMLTHAMTLVDLLTSTHPTVTDILHSVGLRLANAEYYN